MTCSTCGGVAPRCAECVDALVAQLGGTAACRGSLWGERVRAAGGTADWPAYDASDKVRAIARRKVADVAGADRQLLDRLARACAAAAKEEYELEPRVPGSIAPRSRR